MSPIRLINNSKVSGPTAGWITKGADVAWRDPMCPFVAVCVTNVLTVCAYRAHCIHRSAVAESRLHDVAVKAAQVTGGPNLFPAINGFFLS